MNAGSEVSVRDGRPASTGEGDGRRQQSKRYPEDPGCDDRTRIPEASKHEKAPFLKGPPGLKTLAALAMQPRRWYGSVMGKSSIAKHLQAGAGSAAALELGRRVRERRLAIGMTQAELAAPLSRAFVSAVEKGHALPSLGALWLFAGRLGIGVGNLVDGVNGVATPEYTAFHDDRTIHAEPGNRRRPTTASHRR